MDRVEKRKGRWIVREREGQGAGQSDRKKDRAGQTNRGNNTDGEQDKGMETKMRGRMNRG